MKSEIGVYGLGVMGRSIAQNIANHGYRLSVYNHSKELTEQFEKLYKKENVIYNYSVSDFISSLEKPRKVLIMVTAGEAVDSVIEQLLPCLEMGDIIIDGGNSYYNDTIRRFNELKEKGIELLGFGISGGESGALYGPCIMPSGNKEAYNQVKDIFEDIAAKAEDNTPCCNYIGTSGSGHYVKMIHNGIEYADIQIICEAYSFMRNSMSLTIEEIQGIFERWNEGKLKSYLIQITSEILKRKDELTDNYLIDMILDKAEQKGTGKWTGIEGLEIETSIPTIVAAVFSRYLSSRKEERVTASKILKFELNKKPFPRVETIDALENAIYVAKICCYAQGFELLRTAEKKYSWNLDFGIIATIWRAGCIIRADFLNEIKEAFEDKKDVNLILTDKFRDKISQYQNDLRHIVLKMIETGSYAPAFTSSLEYLDGYRTEYLSANLLQAQRDYFGAHTYQRIDRNGVFHTTWE